MAQRPDLFWELKIYYPWLGDDQLALLQGVYHTWRRLAEEGRGTILTMLAGLETPNLTPEQVDAILAFAGVKARLEEEETA